MHYLPPHRQDDFTPIRADSGLTVDPVSRTLSAADVGLV
jgi:hypothetical protein